MVIQGHGVLWCKRKGRQLTVSAIHLKLLSNLQTHLYSEYLLFGCSLPSWLLYSVGVSFRWGLIYMGSFLQGAFSIKSYRDLWFQRHFWFWRHGPAAGTSVFVDGAVAVGPESCLISRSLPGSSRLSVWPGSRSPRLMTARQQVTK